MLSHKLRCYTGIFGPEKSRNNTREKISYFFRCVDIANQLLTRHSPLAPIYQVDEWTAKLSRFSMQVVSRSFLELWRLRHKKIRIADRQWGSNFSRKGGKPIYLKKEPNVTYSVALMLVFLSAENENRQLEDLPPADFGRLPERRLLSVRTKSINENFVNWKLRPLLFL